MRYLWTKRPHQAFMILVSIRNKNRRKWLIPVPIWVVEDTIEAVQDIAWLGERILKLSGKHGEKRADDQWRRYIAGMPVSSALQAVNDFIRELRIQGRFRMVEIEDKAIQVYVDFV